MTLEDPFYVVKDEVFKALNKTRGLYLRWQEISKASTIPNSPEAEWTSTELRNALRSIEWDLEDLEDTINHPSRIVEKNSSKFKIDNKEICDRRSFIEATKQEVKGMKKKMSVNKNRHIDGTAREPLLGEDSPVNFERQAWTSTPKYSRYTKLANQTDSPTRYDYIDGDLMLKQEVMTMTQDKELEDISNSLGTLKTVSKNIDMELDEQARMLEDLNTDLENADSKIGSTKNKIARLLRMNNDRRQWMEIGILIVLLIVVFMLFLYL